MIHAFRSQAIWFLLPASATLIVLLAGPMAYSFWVSFTGWSLMLPGSESDFVGLDNYIAILTSSEYHKAVGVTLIYAIVAVALELVLGTTFAILLNRSFYLRWLFRSVMMIPMVITPSVLGIFWKLFFEQDSGFFNYILGLVGAPKVAWLGLDFALLSIILMDVWQTTPFFMLVILAGLQSLDQEAVEAGMIDGANGRQMFWYIALPHLIPYILIASSFRLIGAMNDFDKIYLLTAGGPGDATTTLSVYTYNTGFTAFDIGRTAAISWLYVALLIVVSLPLIIYMNKTAFRDQ